jgi:hypothetical protein
MYKVVGFNFRPEDEQILDKLVKQLGWNRSQVMRELLSRAVVQEPSVVVVLPSAAADDLEGAGRAG